MSSTWLVLLLCMLLLLLLLLLWLQHSNTQKIIIKKPDLDRLVGYAPLPFIGRYFQRSEVPKNLHKSTCRWSVLDPQKGSHLMEDLNGRKNAVIEYYLFRERDKNLHKKSRLCKRDNLLEQIYS